MRAFCLPWFSQCDLSTSTYARCRTIGSWQDLFEHGKPICACQLDTPSLQLDPETSGASPLPPEGCPGNW